MKYSHLYLKNIIGKRNYINTQRGFGEKPEDENEEEIISKDYTKQKESLHDNWNRFTIEKEARHIKRTIQLPAHLDYILIDFLNDFAYSMKKMYLDKFGLEVIHLSEFNQQVLFYICDEVKFENVFHTLLKEFWESEPDSSPEGHEYNILTFIHSFSFLSTNKIAERFYNGTFTLTLTDGVNIHSKKEAILVFLKKYIVEQGGDIRFITDNTVEIFNINEHHLLEIADNFDIIQKIHSTPPIRVYPSKYGEIRLDWGFETEFTNSLPIIGIIDTGIRPIKPFDNLIQGSTDLVGNGIRCNHGTQVASLATFGRSLSIESESKTANARLYSIQVLYNEQGTFSFSELRDTIIHTHRSNGIRIFNLSIAGRGKSYNSAISEYATMLDILAYEYDLIIFIATGNLNWDDTKENRNYLEGVVPSFERDFLAYPMHFYGPGKQANLHECECSNLCEPAESMNNITVGAIADNLRNEVVDLTNIVHLPNDFMRTCPSYYTRKFHWDYSLQINGSDFNKKQKNKNIFKPDIVMPGGDWFSENSQITVLGFGESFTDFYIKSAGTSLATPLAANLAAKIIQKYPNLSMQTVKALILNSADKTGKYEILEPIIKEYKEKKAIEIFNKNFDNLTKKEKTKVSTYYNTEHLYSKIIGHGLPNEDKCLDSTTKRVTFIIEDKINKKSHEVIHLKLPEYLKNSSKKRVLKITATLCYKFQPIPNDQLGYNPIHISFNFINAKENSFQTVYFLANEKLQNGIRPHTTQEIKEELGIFKEMKSWSEDFYPHNGKINSNTQKTSFNLSIEHLNKINFELALAIRCIGRDSWNNEEENPFSLVVEVEEIPDEMIEQGNLYEEIIALNEVENIASTEIELEADV
jgi:hypothetical protein